MQKLYKLLFVFILLGSTLSPLQAQNIILDETLLTQGSFSTFTPVTVRGTQGWSFNPLYGAMCSGYASGQSYENEDWLVSPAMNLTELENVQLTFNHTRGSAGIMNVGVEQGWYEVFATANYTGDPLTTQWIQLEGLNQNITTAWQYVPSGTIVIPEAAKSASSRIAFRYISSAIVSATWEIKNVRITTDSEITNPGPDAVFRITNWNIEWLGCTANGPEDEDLQINNVATAMLAMNSDVYCIQEVTNTVTNPSIETLVSLLGSDEWGGTIVPNNTGDCYQRQAIIYKKAKVQFVNALEISSGNAAQGGSYNYNWSGGRYPALYNVNLIAGNNLIPVSLVNIHAKAEDNNASSYTRRKGASEALKATLDDANYNTNNLIVIGDFNDYLTGTTSNVCNCTASPYQNFTDDVNNYLGVTNGIIDRRYGNPLIENIVISNELFDNYVSNSTAQDGIAQTIGNYYQTTSNHLPVSASFQFSTLGMPDYTGYTNKSLVIYPNPAKGQLNIKTTNGDVNNTPIMIYDITGRQVFADKLTNNTINVSTLPAGMYILKAGNHSSKFIKE